MPTAISSDKIYLSSEKDTEKLAGKISKKLTPGNIVFLYGEIGVGKTTFIRYLINRFQKETASFCNWALEKRNDPPSLPAFARPTIFTSRSLSSFLFSRRFNLKKNNAAPTQ